MLFDSFAASLTPTAQVRLLVLTALLLCTTVIAETDRAGRAQSDSWSSVFAQPPAYLHARAAIPFDVSGLSSDPPGRVEAALLASVHMADLDTRAHAHMSLAVYYKVRGLPELAAREKRKGDYWRRVAKLASE